MNNPTNSLPDIDWAPILYHLGRQQLVPFLGAGASLGFNGHPGLPTGGELAEELANECDFPGCDRQDLLRVAQFYAIKLGEHPLRVSVQEKLSIAGVKPGQMHHLLANWPVKVVLTTNYDNLMERAFSMAGKDPAKEVYLRQGDQKQIKTEPGVDCPLVYKLHGSLENIDSMVVTEDNYIDFLISLVHGDPKVPDVISNIFKGRSILFIGYGLKDWNIRVLLKYLRTTDIRSFAVQYRSLDAMDKNAEMEWKNSVLYWEHQKISVYNCDALAFVTELDRRWKEANHA